MGKEMDAILYIEDHIGVTVGLLSPFTAYQEQRLWLGVYVPLGPQMSYVANGIAGWGGVK